MSSSGDRIKVTVGHLKTANDKVQVSMASVTTSPPLTTHILDTARGLPAGNVPMILSKQGPDGCFNQIETGQTTTDGRGSFLKDQNGWDTAVYKLHFDTDKYFKDQNTDGFYPFVEVVFRITNTSQHYHVPLLLSPYGYSTYRGS